MFEYGSMWRNEEPAAEQPVARKSTSTKTRYKNISRLDYPAKRMHGYYVRVRWRGVSKQKFFSDHYYGDALAALDAAREWRDATERELGKPRTEALVIGSLRSSNTGIPGVRRLTENHTSYYEATWRDPETNRQRRTRFSITKHGDRAARRLAQQARQRGERNRQAPLDRRRR